MFLDKGFQRSRNGFMEDKGRINRKSIFSQNFFVIQEAKRQQIQQIKASILKNIFSYADCQSRAFKNLMQHLFYACIFVYIFYTLIACGSMSKKTKSSQVPVFINKIYEMIENKDNSEAIDWTSNNDSFSIKNITKFTQEVLPEYFKHRNFASFIRQLNMYGFKKIRHSQGENVYMNQNFKAGAKNLLKNISRKNKEQKEQQLELYQGGRNGRIQAPITKQVQQLKINQKNLEEMCKYFINQNQRILQENQNFVKRLDSQQRAKEQKLQQILIYLLTKRNTNSLLNSSANQPQLSIANQQFQGEHCQLNFNNDQMNMLSPLQQIDKAISQKEQLSNVRNMIRDIYAKKQRNSQPTYTIENHQVINKKDENFNNYVEHPEYSILKQTNHIQNQMKESQRDDPSFFSINDFLNAQGQHDLLND